MYQPTALSTSRSKFPHPFGASGVREFVTLVCLPQTGQIIVPLRESGYEGLNLFGRGISSLRTTSPAYPDISFIAGYPLLVDTTERNASFLGFLRSLYPHACLWKVGNLRFHWKCAFPALQGYAHGTRYEEVLRLVVEEELKSRHTCRPLETQPTSVRACAEEKLPEVVSELV